MKNFLKILCVLLSAVLVFGAARFLDGGALSRTNRKDPAEQTAPASHATAPMATAPEETMSPESVPEETDPEETEPEETTGTASAGQEFTLTLIGNCTLGCTNSVSYQGNGIIKTVGEDYSYPFRNVVNYFEEDEFTFLNLEGPLTDTKAYSERLQLVNGPTSYIQILSQSSVEAVSLVNEHIRDHGEEGYASTISLLEDAGIHYAEQGIATQYTTEHGLTIGIYSVMGFSEKEDAAKIKEDITELASQVDIVIFAPHWGVIGYYLPVSNQTELAHMAIDAGADIVCGTHPYVLQPIEEYNGGVIFYSLGNFCVGSQVYPSDFDSAMIQLQVLRDEDGTVSLGERTIIPVSISSVSRVNNYQPTPYAESDPGYASTLSKLSGTYNRKSIS